MSLARIALLAVVLAGGAISAAGSQTPASGTDSELYALPKHPIPYRVLEQRSRLARAKAKAQEKAKESAPPASGPAAPAPLLPAKPAPPGAGVPSVGGTAPPGSGVPLVGGTAPTPPSGSPAGAPAAAAPLEPGSTRSPPPAAAAPASPPPKPAQPPRPPPEPPPPPALAAPVPGARLIPGQALSPGDVEAFVDGLVSAARLGEHVAGVSVSVVQNGRLVLEKGYGAPEGTALDPRKTLVRLGSASQIFTWIAVMKAVDEGRLKLDQPVNAYLPDSLKIPDEGFERPILLRHLMSQTSGFEERALGRRFTMEPARLLPLEEALRRYRPRRVRGAGSLSTPSDYGAALAGEIVARAEARPFDQLAETEIFRPLGMTRTTFREPYPARDDLPEPIAPGLAGGFVPAFKWTPAGMEPEPFVFGQSLAPAVSASSTADDMARLMIALLGGGRLGEAALFSPKAAASLLSPLKTDEAGLPGWSRGLADERLRGGFEALSETGSGLVSHARIFLVPGLNLGIFIAGASDTSDELVNDLPPALVARFYGSPPPPPPSGGERGRFFGVFLSARRAYHGLEAFVDRLTLRVTAAEDIGGSGLVVSGARRAKVYAALGPGRYQAQTGEEVALTAGPGGRTEALVFGSGGGADERVKGFQSLTALRAAAAAAYLAVFATFAGLFIPDRSDPRETRAQTVAHAVQIGACILWCAAAVSLGLFLRGGLDPVRLMYDWPNNALIAASWFALSAGVLSLAQLVQLPGVWREGRRIHGWPTGRKLRYTLSVGIFLVFTLVLAAWGALEPWSS